MPNGFGSMFLYSRFWVYKKIQKSDLSLKKTKYLYEI